MRVKVDALGHTLETKVQPSSETCEKSIRTPNACVHTSNGVHLIADSTGNVAKFELFEITPVGTVPSKADYSLLYIISHSYVPQGRTALRWHIAQKHI